MTINVHTTWVVLGLLALGGCATQQPDHGHAAGSPTRAVAAAGHHGAERGSMMMHENMASMCPAQVAGTTTRAEHVPGGAALAFTTTGDVAELRRRVTQMAEMHNRHHSAEAQGSTAHEEHADRGDRSRGHGMHGGMGMMPVAQAKAEEIPGGARVVFVPGDAGEIETLRAQVGKMAERMGGEGCPMMMMMEH